MGKKIMVVDDQVGIRFLLKEILEREGYEVLLCANGKEALSVLHQHELSLVFLDMKIPGMDGLEILIQIRKYKPDLKVVVMTAYGELVTIREAVELNVVGYFTKPFDIDDIRLFVNREIGEGANDGRELESE